MMKTLLRTGWVLALAAGCGSGGDVAERVTSNGRNLTIEECTGRNATAAAAGRAGGISMVRQAWASVNDCDRLTAFEQVLRDDVAQLTCAGSDYVTCRCLGLKQGVEDELLGVEVACGTAVSAGSGPSACAGDAEQRAYLAGAGAGASLAAQAWQGCADLALYQDAIADALALLVAPNGASPSLVCRVAGEKDGMGARAEALAGTCGREPN